MTETKQVYRCAVCGNMVEVVHAGGGTLTCCGQPMQLLEANTTDAATEKHVPVIEPIQGGYRVTVGSTMHPMTPAHYIQWIELITARGIMRRYLEPTAEPVAVFMTTEPVVGAREYCNLHGLWAARL